ncbi:hypothetical protein SAMN04488587_1453 [Methanococcoides vulcani]|uniref:Uncharacterized protein n=1 Tax=Methanococcoides vulcani TaxID=1353158 RepID=A0A1I0A6N9_9EURY|nr:hypothetical protein [Methanococcoides vulcani]SES89791.1 hypothetical protein SAMN04488587_1453 [Methanococcoides vulcani]
MFENGFFVNYRYVLEDFGTQNNILFTKNEVNEEKEDDEKEEEKKKIIQMGSIFRSL